jgi:hypothetical protein
MPDEAEVPSVNMIINFYTMEPWSPPRTGW